MSGLLVCSGLLVLQLSGSDEGGWGLEEKGKLKKENKKVDTNFTLISSE